MMMMTLPLVLTVGVLSTSGVPLRHAFHHLRSRSSSIISPARHPPLRLVSEENATSPSSDFAKNAGASYEDELDLDALEGQDPCADFFEPGGEYELDLDELEELKVQWQNANKRWAVERVTDGQNSKTGGVLDDKGSFLSKWFDDPVYGFEATLNLRSKVARAKRRVDMLTRPAFVGAACVLGLRAPVGVARVSARVGLVVHLLLPLLRLVAAKLQRILTPTPAGSARKPVPLADATTILASQHLTGALAILATAAALWSSGQWLGALLTASLGRLALLPGMWHWSDLNDEICSFSTRAGGIARARNALNVYTRVWRLLASFLCVAEAVVLLRTIRCLGRVESAIGSVGGAAVAMLTLLPYDLARAGPHLLSKYGPLLLLGGASPTASPVVRGWVGLLGTTCVTCIWLYAAYWLAFPIEAGDRTWWRARLDDPRKTEGVWSLSSSLCLSAPGIARPSKTVADLLRELALREDPSGGEREQLEKIEARADEASRLAVENPFASRRKDYRYEDDLRRVMWSLGPSDAIESDFLTSARIGGGDGVDGVSAFPELVEDTVEVVTARGLTSGEDEEWAYMELARLLVTEDAARERKRRKRMEQRIAGGETPEEAAMEDDDFQRDEVAWSNAAGEANVQRIFLEQAQKFAKDGQAAEELAELLRLKYSLERWAIDPPPGYKGLDDKKMEWFETALEEKRQRRKEMRQRPDLGSVQAGAGEEADEMVAAMAESVDAFRVGEMAAAPGSETVRLREEEEDDDDVDDDDDGEEKPLFV